MNATCRAKELAELAEAEEDAAAAAQYQELLAAQDAERQAALQEMYAKSATRAVQAGKQVLPAPDFSEKMHTPSSLSVAAAVRTSLAFLALPASWDSQSQHIQRVEGFPPRK